LPRRRPLFSIVSAVYNVEPYLSDFLRSIEAQTIDPGLLEVVAVDDGSTDGSLGLLESWRARSRLRITVLTQANAGQSTARNAGMAAATGEWVIAADPDDVLDKHFFKAAQDFAHAHPDIEIMGSNVWILSEALGRERNNHPRRGQFAAGTRVVDLDRHPNVYPGSGTVAFLRLDRIRSLGLSYDAELRPSFEDAHFSARYVMSLERPVAGLLADAVYLYRKRIASDSTMQRSFEHAGRYGTVLERGYLDLFRFRRSGRGGSRLGFSTS